MASISLPNTSQSGAHRRPTCPKCIGMYSTIRSSRGSPANIVKLRPPLSNTMILVWGLLLLLGLAARGAQAVVVGGSEIAPVTDSFATTAMLNASAFRAAVTAATAADPASDTARATQDSVLSSALTASTRDRIGLLGAESRVRNRYGTRPTLTDMFNAWGSSQRSPPVSTEPITSRAPAQTEPSTKPKAGFYKQLKFKSPTIASLLVALPGSSRYLMLERVRGDEHLQTASLVDIASGETRSFQLPFDHFCGGVVVQEDGNPLLVGGYNGNRAIKDGKKVISIFDGYYEEFVRVGTMKWARWYPTPVRISDYEVLIVGGTFKGDGGEAAPYAEVWSTLPEVNNGGTWELSQPERFIETTGMNWYPFMALLPEGHLLWWGDIGGSITDLQGNLIIDLPPLPDSITYRTMYPHTATPLILALSPENGYKTSLVIFGGAPDGANSHTEAISTVLRLNIAPCEDNGYCFGRGWEVDDMLGIRRVMGDSVLLPNGRVLVLNGAQNGIAGYSGAAADGNGTKRGRASFPNTVALSYNPTARVGRRFQKLAPTKMVRLYHSTACLHHTGEVLVAGCDTCTQFDGEPENLSRNPDGALERRLQLVVPPELASGAPRPVIVAAPDIIVRGETFEVDYDFGGDAITGASLAAPCGSTHSINMNQRVVFLKVQYADDQYAVLEAPPAHLPALAPSGFYILFLLGPNGVYSEGRWLKLVI